MQIVTVKLPLKLAPWLCGNEARFEGECDPTSVLVIKAEPHWMLLCDLPQPRSTASPPPHHAFGVNLK